MRQIGVIMTYTENDPEGQARPSALRDESHNLEGSEGSNIQIEYDFSKGKA